MAEETMGGSVRNGAQNRSRWENRRRRRQGTNHNRRGRRKGKWQGVRRRIMTITPEKYREFTAGNH